MRPEILQMVDMAFIIDIIGWLGAGALLLAYVLVSSKRMDGQSMVFQGLNVIGALFLILNSAYYGAYPSAFLNVVWAGIAVYTVVHVRYRQSRPC